MRRTRTPRSRPGFAAGRRPEAGDGVGPGLELALESLVDPATRGDPQSPLRWTCKSTRKLAEELTRQGHPVSHADGRRPAAAQPATACRPTARPRKAARHPDRNAQFEHINARSSAFQRRGQPVISVDTKKKELVGDFKNGGREWQPKGEPEEVRVHDFLDKELGKAIPYGVYDLTGNQGWVSVGIDHDTAEFAVETHPPLVAARWAASAIRRRRPSC